MISTKTRLCYPLFFQVPVGMIHYPPLQTKKNRKPMTKAVHNPAPISPELAKAYAEAQYQVADPRATFTIHPGEYSPELMSLYLDNDTFSSALLTAHNPLSNIVTDAENTAAQHALEAELTDIGFTFLSGYGCDGDGAWPREVSALVLGIDFETAKTISMRYGQNAFLFASDDAVPKLILNR